jgi:hypothetical protein
MFEVKFVLVNKTDFNLAPLAGEEVKEIVTTSLNLKFRSAVGKVTVNVGAPGSEVTLSGSFEHEVNIEATNVNAAIDLNKFFILILLFFSLLQIKGLLVNVTSNFLLLN